MKLMIKSKEVDTIAKSIKFIYENLKHGIFFKKNSMTLKNKVHHGVIITGAYFLSQLFQLLEKTLLDSVLVTEW